MPTQLLTIPQAKTIRNDGGVELVTHDGLIQPDRSKFTNPDDLNAYLSQTLGGKLEGGGIHGSMSRTGTYSRRAADGSQAVTFGDPVLDAISSPAGTVDLAGQTIDLRAAGSGVVFSAPALKFTGIVNGAERWATDDGSMVEYRIGHGRLTFHAWKKSVLFYWSMGGEISVTNTSTHFEAADIWAFSYMSVPGQPPCQVYNSNGHASGVDDGYLDKYDWGINAQQPERVAALCRAQWHHERFRDLVTAGEGCLRYLEDDWVPGFPTEWNTIQTLIPLNGNWTDGSSRSAVIVVKFRSLSVDMSAYHRPAAHGIVDTTSTMTVTFPDDKTYTASLEPPNTIRWSNGSTWSKIVNTVMDLNGIWTDGTRKAVIFEGAQSITIDMSDYDRPAAKGSIVNASTIKVNFPDDAEYTGTLQAPNTIKWSNGSAWTRV